VSGAITPRALHECGSCGQFQVLPALTAGQAARCVRCETTLRRARTDTLDRSLALNVAALILLVVMATTVLMTVSTGGITIAARLLSGPEELVRRGMPALALVVLFVTLIAPAARLGGMIYVLLRLRAAQPPRHLARIFGWVERLTVWSMIDVFVFGVFVAYVKLGDLVTLHLQVGVYALLALTVVIVWADSTLDRHAVWEALETARPEPEAWARVAPKQGRVDGAIGCETCGLVSNPPPGEAHCPRCQSRLHRRKPDSVARTWALVIAAAVLYVPANYFPVLTVVQLGAGAPSTILGGVEELVQSGMYPLALLVLFASILVPMLKLCGLALMLTTVQLGARGRLRDRTKLYHIVRWIGRWSMIDIFMESLLGALVRFGALVTIEPGIGAVAFCAVVILTMFAAETFDPRLMWDAAEKPEPVTAPAGARPGGLAALPAP
jgi:paraquat-inducible protein A